MEHFTTQTASPCDWLTAHQPVLGREDVHIWRAGLDASPDDLGLHAQTLSTDEQERAGRFRIDRDRRRFIVRRAIVRTLLAQYLDASAAAVAFVQGPQGKPALASPFDRSGLCFSVSHSQDLALVAVTHDRAVGVDVEWIRPLSESDAIARRYFSSAENLMLDGLDPVARRVAFFKCWTRIEAHVKATGEGLAHRLDAAGIGSAQSPTVDGPLRTGPSAEPWSILNVAPAPGFVGAVAAAGDRWTLRCWRRPGQLL